MNVNPYSCPARDSNGGLPIAYMARVMTDAANGAVLQIKLHGREWCRDSMPSWDWTRNDYRIDPATRTLDYVQIGDYVFGGACGIREVTNHRSGLLSLKGLNGEHPTRSFRMATQAEIAAHLTTPNTFKPGDYLMGISADVGLYLYKVGVVSEYVCSTTAGRERQTRITIQQVGQLTWMGSYLVSSFRMATADEIRRVLLADATKRGFVHGAHVKTADTLSYKTSYGSIQRVYVETVDGKPVVMLDYGPTCMGWSCRIDQATLKPSVQTRVPMTSEDYPVVFWLRFPRDQSGSAYGNGASWLVSYLDDKRISGGGCFIHTHEEAMTKGVEYSVDRRVWRGCYKEVVS